MTKRRLLLQRLALLPLAVLLCALLVGCGGGSSKASDACPVSLRNGTPRPRPIPQYESLASAVDHASEISQSVYIGQFNRERAYQAALSGARAAAEKFKVAMLPEASPSTSSRPLLESYRESLKQLDALIRDETEEQQIIDGALREFAKSFDDDHTYFLSKQIWEAHQEGSIYWDGLIDTPLENTGEHSVITEVMPGTSAKAAGLAPGDIVLRSAFTSDLDRTLSIQKRAGGIVELTLSPHFVPWMKHDLLDGDIGYIRLYEFPSYISCEGLIKIRGDLDNAIEDLKKGGARSWVLDLRDNGGGNPESAGFVAAHFGFDGVLMRQRSKYGYFSSNFEIASENAIDDMPLVILTNGSSASAAEVVAFVLQDSKRAMLIGTKTSGSVVGTLPNPLARGALFVSAAFVDVGPGNKVLDKTGVTPDKKVTLDLELLRREGRDSQLEAATDYLKQKLGR